MKLFICSFVALLAEGVDRNNLCRGQVARLGESPSSQRAWIEICTRSALVLSFVVALLAEGVDRNYKGLRKYEKAPVALLAEGVDRNLGLAGLLVLQCVALLAEGVDRNISPFTVSSVQARSPSSQRAWIEILFSLAGPHLMFVALLAEGVDRNLGIHFATAHVDRSPSSQRAWIEIV